MTGKLTAIGIISMAVLLTGAGCVEAATTANTVFKTETEGVYAAAEQADAEVGKSLFDLPTPRPTIAPVKIKISQSPLPTPPAENPYTVDGNVSEDAASPAASPVPANTPDSSDKPEYTVEDMDDTAGYVYAKSINLRSGPGEDYKIVREYQQNRKVTITGKSGDWYRVRVGKRKGFMLMEYIKLGDPPESTPKPTEKPKATSKPKSGRQGQQGGAVRIGKIVHIDQIRRDGRFAGLRPQIGEQHMAAPQVRIAGNINVVALGLDLQGQVQGLHGAGLKRIAPPVARLRNLAAVFPGHAGGIKGGVQPGGGEGSNGGHAVLADYC